MTAKGLKRPNTKHRNIYIPAFGLALLQPGAKLSQAAALHAARAHVGNKQQQNQNPMAFSIRLPDS